MLRWPQIIDDAMRKALSLRDIYCQEDALRHPDPQVRIAAVHHAVARLTPGQQLPALLRRRVRDDHPAVARYALVELLQAGVPEAFVYFLQTMRQASPEQRTMWRKCLRNCFRFPFAILLDDLCGLESISPTDVAGRDGARRPAATAKSLSLSELIQLSADQFLVRAIDPAWRQSVIRLLSDAHLRMDMPRRCYHGFVLQPPAGDLPGFLEAEDLLFQFGGETLINGPACAVGREALFTAAREDPTATASVVYVLDDRPPRGGDTLPAFMPRPAGLLPGIVAQRIRDGRCDVWCADGKSFSCAFPDGHAALGKLVLVESPRGTEPRRAHAFGDHPLDAAAVQTYKQMSRDRRTFPNSIGMQFARVPVGEFHMGSAETVDELLKDFPYADRELLAPERPEHSVRLTKPFGMAIHPVTGGQFRQFVDATSYKTEAERDGKGGWGCTGNTWQQAPKFTWRSPGFDQTDEHPVVNVTWNDAQAFVTWLAEAEKRSYRLPTEAEWEYAARAGTATRHYGGDDPELLARIGNVADASAKRRYPTLTGTITADDDHVFTSPVGSFAPNSFGLYDMIGNVWEWCQDRYSADYYANSPEEDPPGPAAGKFRVLRGGAWNCFASYCRSAFRNHLEPKRRNLNIGIRVVLSQFPDQ